MFAKAVWIRIWTVCSSSELRLVQRELDHSACIVSLQSRSDALANSRSVWRVEEKFIAAELSKFCNRLTSRLVTPCQPAAEEHLSDATNGLNDIPSEATGPEEFQRPYDHNDLCDSNPEFSVICSFISKFGVNIDLKLNIERLKETIENQETLDDDLIEIHVKLLKKLRRYFNRDQWEKALIRFAYEYSHEDGYELESLGYLKTRPSIKLSLLRRLLDAQFECDPKFKASVNAIDADELRNQPTGRDIKGNIYWHCEDDEGNVRVYRDEPLNYAAWKTVCKNPDDLKTLLGELENSKGEIVKGEPQLEPYNPYPQIFSELFVNVEKTDTPPKKSVRKGRGRHKKSSPLHTLKELDENTIIQESPCKPDSASNQNSLTKDVRPCSSSPTGSASVESQVKQTIENILIKVTSSFEFIFRRGSPEEPKPKLTDEPLKKATKPKKRREPVELPRRTSSRIQQLQQKKELEQEEIFKKKRDQVEKQSIKQHDSCSRDSVVSDVKSKKRARKKEGKRWRNIKGKKKLSWDKDDSDLSSTSSLTETDDESFMQAINGHDIDENDEDEFACEDEESNDVPVIIKKARTARQTSCLELGDLNNTTLIEEDKPCGRCEKSNDPDTILLCDMCDDGYHTACCIPTLMYVPDGDWFCPSCEHKALIDKLTTVLSSIEAVLAIKERERAKREKLRQARKESAKPETSNHRRKNLDDDPITLPLPKLDNRVSFNECLSPSYRERSYKRPKKKVSETKRNKNRSSRWSDSDEDNYRVNRKSKKTYHGDFSSTESEGLDLTESSHSSESSESPIESEGDDKPKIRKARARVSYNFQEYDELIRAAICADSDKIDAGLTDHEEDEDQADTSNVGRGKDMATIEALAYQQENGLIDADAPTTNEKPDLGATVGPKKPVGPKKKGRKLNDLDADSEIDIATSDESFQAPSSTEEEEEEEEDDEPTEISSSNDDSSIDEIVNIGNRPRTKKKRRRSPSSDDSDFLPRTRRAAAKQVSYWESSDEGDELIGSTLVPMPLPDIAPPPPAPHPPFYTDEELDPTKQNPGGKQET